MNRKTVIVLGAGNAQLPLIAFAKRAGYYVIVVTPKGCYPGIDVADEVLDCDVADVGKIFKSLRNRNVCAVASEELDVAVPSVAALSEKFGVRGNPPEVAMRFKNKYEMRKAAKQLGVDVPGFAHAMTRHDLPGIVEMLEFPLMIKPVDNASSKGVKKVYNLKDLEQAFDVSSSYSENGVIIEEFIEGEEYVVEAYTHNGWTANLIVGKSEYFNIKDAFIPRSRLFIDAPSAVKPLEMRLKELNAKIVKGFGLVFGVTHGEYMYSPERNKVYLIEIAARGGGVNIASKIIPKITGVNVGELIMSDALGNEVAPFPLKSGAAGYVTLLLPEGVVGRVDGLEDVSKIDGVFYHNLGEIKVGDRTYPPHDKRSRKGPILVCGRTKGDCLKTVSLVRDTFHVHIATDGGIDKEIWL